MQLRFASLAVINSREDLHLQECAHAGRTKKRALKASALLYIATSSYRADVSSANLALLYSLISSLRLYRYK